MIDISFVARFVENQHRVKAMLGEAILYRTLIECDSKKKLLRKSLVPNLIPCITLLWTVSGRWRLHPRP